MAWTEELGKAVLNQRADVMDTVQRLRQRSYDYGYLHSSPYDAVVNSAGYIEILPTNSEDIYVHLRPGDCVCTAAARIRDFSRYPLRSRGDCGGLVWTLGMVQSWLRVGNARHRHRPIAVEPSLVQSRLLCSPLYSSVDSPRQTTHRSSPHPSQIKSPVVLPGWLRTYPKGAIAMRVIPATPRILLPIVLLISAGITAGCNSQPSATQNPQPSNPTPSQPGGSCFRSTTAPEP